MTASNRLKAFLNFMDGEDGDLKDFPPSYMEEGFRADLREVLEERDALRKALEPFAERAVGLEDFDDEDTVQFDPRINVGDFRRARQALTGAPDHG